MASVTHRPNASRPDCGALTARDATYVIAAGLAGGFAAGAVLVGLMVYLWVSAHCGQVPLVGGVYCR